VRFNAVYILPSRHVHIPSNWKKDFADVRARSLNILSIITVIVVIIIIIIIINSSVHEDHLLPLRAFYTSPIDTPFQKTHSDRFSSNVWRLRRSLIDWPSALRVTLLTNKRLRWYNSCSRSSSPETRLFGAVVSYTKWVLIVIDFSHVSRKNRTSVFVSKSRVVYKLSSRSAALSTDRSSVARPKRAITDRRDRVENGF